MRNSSKLRNLSIAALASIASLGFTNGASAADTTTITTPLPEGIEKTIELQTTYGEGNTSVTTNYTVLGQEIPYTYKFDNLYGEENGDTSVTTESTVLGQPVTFTYKYENPDNKTYTTKYENYSYDYGTVTNPSGTSWSSPYLMVGNSVFNNLEGSTKSINNELFSNNSVTGTIESTATGNKYAKIGGGAISNAGELTKVVADFVGNSVNGNSIRSKGGPHIDVNGGAIYNSGLINDITGNFIGNYVSASDYSYLYGGAIYNVGAIGNITGDFVGNYVTSVTVDFYADADAEAYGGAICNSANSSDIVATIGNITGDFIGNYVTSSEDSWPLVFGGAIYNSASSSSTAKIDNLTGNFIGNYVQSTNSYAYGGAIYNFASSSSIAKIDNLTGDFIGNYASSTSNFAKGGAVYNFAGTSNSSAIIGNINGVFIGNYLLSDHVDTEGGAIYNGAYNSNSIATIGNITANFIGNYIQSQNPEGGAIYNYDSSGGTATIGNITGNFIGNYVNSTFNVANGGSIYNGNGTIGDITGNFVGNYATSSSSSKNYGVVGGAIYNGNGTIGDITGNFVGNYATLKNANGKGGAIYNSGAGATIGDITGDFIGNFVYSSSDTSGGAIYNYATIGDITGNFIGNYAKSTNGSAYGGAIHNDGSVLFINSSFINNYAKSETGTAQGGAIYTDEDLSIVAKDGYTSVFSGNYTESNGEKDDNAIMLGNKNVILNFNMKTGGKILLQDSISGSGVPVSEFYTSNGVADFEEYARSQGYKDTPTETFLANTDYSTVEEYTRSLGYMDTPIETFLADTGYSTVDEALRAAGFADTPTETYLNMTGYSSLEEAVKDSGFATVDEFLEAIGYETFDEALKVEMGLYGDTPEEQFLNMNGGYETFEEFLKEEQGLYGDTPEEQFVHQKGYETFEEYLKAKENLAGDTPEEQLLYKLGYKSVRDYLKAKGYGVSTVNIQGDDINNTVFYLYNEIRNANVDIGNTTINTINNLVHNYNFESLTLTADTNMVVDVDLKNQTMDRFTASEYGSHSGNLNVTGMNLLSDAVSDNTEILFAEQGLKDNVTYGAGELPHSNYQTEVYTPIYKYNVAYDNRDDAGYFVFARQASSSGNQSEVFNPAVLGSSTSATVGAVGTINQTMHYAFQNSADFMNIPYLERISIRDRNKYAISVTGDATDMGRFSPLYQPSDESSSVWVKPYATFENVPLKNGPKVSNITYGTLVGFDTEMQSIKRGWDRVWTGYIGYNGASQRYAGIDSTQNGGLIGGTMTLYKGNFFNATTVSVGANVANNQTMYGSEDFAMLLSGIGNKTGYNFEFKEGKLILQPSMLMSYTFVNTFDYTNAAGVKIDNKPLHALQLAPGVKVIGNLKGGWQPYASVSMVWNLMGESDATANGVKLPEMSIKPYVQYGVGLQKRIKDHFMAYGQAMVQNGGRNGVSLTAGFRWAIGHDNCKYENQKVDAKKQDKISSSNEILRSAQNDRGKYIGHYEERSDVVMSSSNASTAQNDYKCIGHPEEGEQRMKAKAHLFNASRTEGSLTNLAKDSSRVSHVQNDRGRKILKQMTPEQRAAYGGKYYNTSRTAKSGSLRQY